MLIQGFAPFLSDSALACCSGYGEGFALRLLQAATGGRGKETTIELVAWIFGGGGSFSVSIDRDKPDRVR